MCLPVPPSWPEVSLPNFLDRGLVLFVKYSFILFSSRAEEYPWEKLKDSTGLRR